MEGVVFNLVIGIIIGFVIGLEYAKRYLRKKWLAALKEQTKVK